MILCYFLTDICVNGDDDSSMPQGRKKYNIMMIVQYVIFSLTQSCDEEGEHDTTPGKIIIY